MANVFQLFGQIFIDNSEANASIDKTTEKAESASSKVGSAFSTIAAGAAKVATVAIGTASALGAGAYAMVNSTATQADTIDKLSERTSINREELQRWMHACDQSGVSSDVLETAVKKMSSTLDDAAQGSATALDSLSRLGVSLEDLEGLSTEKKLNKIIEALADMEDGTERNALGADLLGKGYTEMLPLLNAGSEGIAALKKEADELGIVMSEDSVKAGVVFGDTIANIKAAVGGFVNLLSNSLLPVAQSAANLVISALPMIQGFFAELAPAIQQAFDNLIPALLTLAEALFPVLMEFLAKLLPILVDLTAAVLPVIVSLLQMLLPLLEPLLELLVVLLEPLVELLNIISPLVVLITQIIDKIMPLLQASILGLADSLQSKFKFALEVVGTVFTNLKNILTNIIDFVKNVFTGNWKGAWTNVKNIFSSIWDSMKAIVKAPINFIISGINALIGGINKISFDVPNWVPGIGGKKLGFDIPKIPKLRRGLEYVPYDNYPALLHKGEQVLTASEKRQRDQEKKEKQENPKKDPSIVVKVNVHIERFENYSPSDIDELVEELIRLLEEKIRGKGGVFA